VQRLREQSEQQDAARGGGDDRRSADGVHDRSRIGNSGGPVDRSAFPLDAGSVAVPVRSR
jgi:hypothetical protein